MEQAISACDSSDRQLRSVLDKLVNYPNVPRKEAKFINFLTNSLKVREAGLAKRAWQAIDTSIKSSTAAANNKETTSSLNNGQSADEKSKEVEVRNNGAAAESNGADQSTQKRLKLKSTIKRIIKSAPNRQIKLKRLQKRVLEIYRSQNQGDDEQDWDDLLKGRILDKLTKIPRLTITDTEMVTYSLP